MRLSARRILAYLSDAVLLCAAFLLAHLYRTFFGDVHWGVDESLLTMGVTISCQLLCLRITGCRRIPWRYVIPTDVLRLWVALALAALPPIVWRYTHPEAWDPLPFSYAIIVLDTLIAQLLLTSARLFMRAITDGYPNLLKPRPRDTARTLLIGAATTDSPLIRTAELTILGILERDPALQGTRICGYDVLGTPESTLALVKQLGITHLLLHPSALDPTELRRLILDLRATDCHIQILPTLTERPTLRPPDITDLLRRPEVELPTHSLAPYYRDQTIWITGAGGSIGSELTRQLATLQPKRLLLLEQSEYALYELNRTIERLYPQVELCPILGDCGDESLVAPLLKRYPPKAIFHAAASKHVPLLEQNSRTALSNNTLATDTLARLARQAHVDTFLFVSTDKAIEPVSIMGISKRLAEVLLGDHQADSGTKFATVRFGNVLGSSGSVIPLFREQIARGGPVTITHPGMMRYFMTVREAAALILQTATLAQGGQTYLLDMGKPINITELAEEMIRLSGHQPHSEIPIIYTHPRPGERLVETLGIEQAQPTTLPKIYLAPTPTAPHAVAQKIRTLLPELIAQNPSPDTLRTTLAPYL